MFSSPIQVAVANSGSFSGTGLATGLMVGRLVGELANQLKNKCYLKGIEILIRPTSHGNNKKSRGGLAMGNPFNMGVLRPDQMTDASFFLDGVTGIVEPVTPDLSIICCLLVPTTKKT